MDTSWKTYFDVERVLAISSQFNQLMDGWQINGAETKNAFDDFYRRKIKKVYKPKLSSSGLTMTKPMVEPEIKIQATKKYKKKTKKEKKMPPKEVIPAPKRRKEEELSEIITEPEKILTIRIAKENIPPKATVHFHGLDVYEPILMMIGRPSTQLHYAKLCRFAQKLKVEGRQLPFLLRNIVVEDESQEQ